MTLLSVGVVDWSPIIIAVGAAIALIAPSIATYIQAKANGHTLGEVHQMVNGGMDDVRLRIAAIEKHLAESTVVQHDTTQETGNS